MPYSPRNQRFTIYDYMETRGVFASNPANADSMSETGEPLYRGPQEYPKMFYHPTGEERITIPAEIILTPVGPKAVSEQKEIIHKVALNEEEAQALIDEGWHDHPARALKAGGREAPAMSSDQRIKDLETELARLQAPAAALEPKGKLRTSVEVVA